MEPTTDLRNTGIDLSMPLNAIVSRHPRLVTLMEGFGFDTCCGGAEPLQSAARRNGLDPEAVKAALEAALGGATVDTPDSAGSCGCGCGHPASGG